ncbi:hypothetical protein ETB97_008972 [Aspergillus alliaceus]|uniref:Nudix hydrolase domain-containing protein n=1 Tax=Petromyces alliaceus TaxID=209559 RepID=A0A8H6E1U5_PETAA|nr:hypothetical protein ETB97_008972 [Aspergillus burnettii]
MEAFVDDPNGSYEIIPVPLENLQDTKYRFDTIYTMSSGFSDELVNDLLLTLLKKGLESKASPPALEVPGRATEEGDINLLFSACRELLEENGILILCAKPLNNFYIYLWIHKDRKTGEYKSLIKFIFVYIITNEHDARLFSNRVWDSGLNGPQGAQSILFDPEEVSDTFAITKNQMDQMILWDPEHRKLAEDPKYLVTRRQTYIILEHMFDIWKQLEKPPNDTNRIAYLEKTTNSDIPELKLDGEPVSITCLEKGLADLVENVKTKRFGSPLDKGSEN